MVRHWIDDAWKSLNATETEYKAEWNSMIYRLAGKMVGMRGSYKDARPILTIKLPPAQGQMLRDQFEHIIPGYYSNKTHYNSIFLDVGFDHEFITDLLDDSWHCVYESLPKKTQVSLHGSGGEPGPRP